MRIHPTSFWTPVGNSTYSKREIYQLIWDVDLTQQIAIAAPFGGPIVVMRDQTKFIELNSQNNKPIIRIYTASGQEISSMLWESSKGNIVCIDWIEKERLAIVLQSAQVLIFNVFCELLLQFNLGDIVRKEEILECKIWNDGVVVMTSEYNFYSVPSINDFFIESGRVVKLAVLPEEPQQRPSWAILEPQFTLSQCVEVFVSVNGTLYLIDEDKADSQLEPFGIVLKMAISPCGKKMACFNKEGILWIFNTDGNSNTPLKFDTKSPKPPMIKWCGTDGVMMYWESANVLLYFSLTDPWLKLPLDSPISLVTEIDGIRMISNQSSDFFQKVPDVTVDIFKIGSTSPAAMLYDATDHFISQSPRADESIRSIKNELEHAVNACIQAASFEFSGSEQSRLLKSASFGKCFLDGYNPNLFVNTCRSLRVLNAVRHFEIGIPLTMAQYRYLGADELIERLINRRKHLLAWRMCDYLKIKSDIVLNHWASTKVRTKVDDAELSKIIINKLEAVPGISFANIASAAYVAGKRKLATKLLEYEPKAADQVPPLIKMGESEMALNKAIESGDTELVYLVLLDMKRNLPLADFLEVSFSKTVALDLLISFCKQSKDFGLLKEIYDIKGQSKEMSNIILYEAFRDPDFDSRLRGLHKAIDQFMGSKDKDDVIYAKLTEDQVKLEVLQKELENGLQDNFLGMTISDTIYKLILLSQHKRVNNFKSEFKIPDKRFWWIKIKALSVMGDWEELQKFSKEKKSPIGYEPFAEVCLEQNNQIEALKYIPKIVDVSNRVQFYIQVNYFREAAETAFKDKNIDLLNLVFKKCTNPEVQNLIDQMRTQLQRK
eukprot:gene2241-2763_t